MSEPSSLVVTVPGQTSHIGDLNRDFWGPPLASEAAVKDKVGAGGRGPGVGVGEGLTGGAAGRVWVVEGFAEGDGQAGGFGAVADRGAEHLA